MFNLKSATPVIERNDGILEPEELIDLTTAEPIVEGELIEKPVKPSMFETATKITLDSLYNMPILGGFSPKQIDTPIDIFRTIEAKERSASFKWFVMGMPADLKSIEKAENIRWAELAYKSPWAEDVRNIIGQSLDAAVKGVGVAVHPLLQNIKFPEGITKETLKNLPIEVVGDLTEFATDPAALLIAFTIGKGFEKLPMALQSLKSRNPLLYTILTKELGKNKPNLKAAYKVLGVEDNMSMTQISKKYRKLAFEHHPDKGGDPVKLGEIADAYKLITNTRESIFNQINRFYKGTKLGSEKGIFVGKDLIKKYKLTPKQVGNIEKGIMEGLPQGLIGELAAMSVTPAVTPKAPPQAPEAAKRGIVEGGGVEEVFRNAPQKMKDLINVKAVRIVDDLEGEGGKYKNGIIYIEKGEPIAETIAHETSHNIIEKFSDKDKGFISDYIKEIFKDRPISVTDNFLKELKKATGDNVVRGIGGFINTVEERMADDIAQYVIDSSKLSKEKKTLFDKQFAAPQAPTKAPEVAEPPKPKERGFVTSVKEELPALKVAGQYIPRSTDELAIKAKTLIKEDLATAQNMALKGTDDAAIAIGAELLKKYSQDAEAQKDEVVKDAIYEKAAELANSMATRLTELGRSVQAAAILSRLTPEGQIRFAAKTIQKYNEKIDKTKGGLLGLRKKIPELTPEQIKEILSRMKDIGGMPEGQQKAIMFKELQDYITDLVPTPLIDKIITVWKAGLLTGIKTSGLNIFSNIAHAISETVKDIPATLVDIVVSVGTGKRSVAFTTTGTLKGTKEGADKGWRFLKTGYDERNVLAKYDYKRVNMGSSKVAKGIQKYEETIFNILGTEDQPFYYGAKMRSLYEQAKVAAINKGLKGDAAKAFIDNLVMNPTDEMALLSVEDAKIAVYQNETALGNLAKKFQQLGPVAEFILPFGRTPSAVATQILNYTPVGTMKTIIGNIGKGRFNQRDFSKGIGRGITGTAILGLGAYLFKEGLVNLDRPKTEAEQKLWELEGRSPNTIKIGNKWRTVQTFGPLGNVVLIGGHFMKAYQDSGSIAAAFIQGGFGGMRSFTEQTFLQNVKRALDAYDDPKRSAGNFISSFLASAVPTLIKDVAVATDPKVRTAQGLTQKLIARIPLLRQILEPKVDVFGRDIDRDLNFFETMADPTRPSKMKTDPIVMEIRRLVDADFPIKTTQLGTKFGFKSLTQEENTSLWRESGRNAYERISEFMSDDNYEAIPDDIKAKRINKFISDAQDNARIAIAIEKTGGLEGEELKNTLMQMVEDKLLTQELYRKYLRSR